MLSLKAGSRYWHNHGNIENVKAANAVSLWEVRFVAFLLPDEEQDANEEKLSELERQHKEKSAAVTNAEQFAESLAQCAGMKKLTATVLNTLIEKIEVNNPVMVNGVKEQKLTVYYKFVGQID